MHFLSSIGNGAKKREGFLVSKVVFNFWISSGIKLYLLIQFSLVGFMLSKKRQS